MSSSDSHSSSSAHPEERMQYPRKTRGRQPGWQQESFSQDFIMEITFSDILGRLPAWPEIRSSGTGWVKRQRRNNYKDQLHSVRSEPVAEWIHGSLGARPGPGATRVGCCLIRTSSACILTSPAPHHHWRLTLHSSQGHFLASHTSPDLDSFCRKDQFFTCFKVSVTNHSIKNAFQVAKQS